MRATRQLIGLSLALGLAARPATGGDLRDLYFGEALYHAYQGQYFDALQRLDTELAQYHVLDEPELDTLHYHINDAEFSVGDFELDYRMHQRAGRAIKAVLEGAVDEAVRNEAAFRLARIQFQKGQLDDALQALARIKGTVPEEIRGDVEFLRANVYMATGQPSEAVKVLAQLKSNESLAGFVAYNLGIARLQDGRTQEAIEQLDKAGQLPAGDPASLAIRDKSNLGLRNLPDAPETYYLMELMASHDFQTALQNYLDLEDLRSRLITWKTSLDAFDDIIRLRGQNYEPLLPEVDAQFRELDSRIRLRLEQRKHLAERLQAILTAPRPDYLVTAEEQIAGERIARIEKQLDDSAKPESIALRQRAARLRGALTWRLETEYNERLTAAYAHLNELNAPVDALTRQYDAFVRTRQAATHSYVGYDVQIARLHERVGDALQRVDILMARQGHMIETVAINQLEAPRERLVAQQNQALYGVADSYDPAARAQSGAEGR